MERWVGKIALVTGASSGIGQAIAASLVQHGLRVVALARSLDRMEEMRDELRNEKGTYYPKRCDLRIEEDIVDAFKFADAMGGADLLVNNAGLWSGETIIGGTTENYKNILDVNVLAAAICTREATKSMIERNAEGLIVNISSVLGHNASKTIHPSSLYQASKYALTAISEVVRNEITAIKAPIKVTNLSPGLVKTNICDLKEEQQRNTILEALPHLQSKDIAHAVLYLLGTPPNVQVEELTIAALHECYLNITV